MGASKSDEIQIKAVDDLLASADLRHGVRSRSPRGGGDQAPRIHSTGHAPARPGEIDVIQVPEWAEMDWLLHGFSTRTGGCSLAYLSDPDLDAPAARRHGELNLGFTASDSAENVAENRARFVAAVCKSGRALSKSNATKPPQLFVQKQIHSSLIRRLSKRDFKSNTTWKGDGLMSSEPGVVLGVLTADCIPVLIADRRRRAVAAFHAGWRGTLQRIVENGVGRMRLEFGSRSEDLVAAIGSGIGQCCYSVGEEVRSEFTSQFAYADELFCEIYDSDPVREKYPLLFMTARAPGHSPIGPSTHLDLMEANKRQLLDAGLSAAAIHVVGECTSCRADRFFSHRAGHGHAGRMLSVVGIRRGCDLAPAKRIP
jgi:YfiH family protein